ncbi:hypothetical protein [Thermoactinospora rubra]|uniref:hypothetical protein n=1 Tax=Thermoactinospora rubra TaxID=1088767 RepID=UPI001301FBD0|nr:hypothetical protein [Thermoactinospora rubra]
MGRTWRVIATTAAVAGAALVLSGSAALADPDAAPYELRIVVDDCPGEAVRP